MAIAHSAKINMPHSKYKSFTYLFSSHLPIPPLDKNLLGSKGKNLAEMCSIGIPVPPGFIITTEACNAFRKNHFHFPMGLEEEIWEAMKSLEDQMHTQLGNISHPLLISVRSGARVSMPGMMDTILNLGLNDRTVLGFAEMTHNDRLAFDSYRRFIMMYSDIVYGINRHLFEETWRHIKDRENVKEDFQVSNTGLKNACQEFKHIFEQHAHKPFPQDSQEQLFEAIAAVFKSWDSERATLYRQLNHIPEEWGTAVIAQVMVFGNKNQQSATGVGFTRDPATGENEFFGEFLLNAQGEEVVAGTRTPHPLNKYQKSITKSPLESLEELMPQAYKDLEKIIHLLEEHYRDMQDIEFTIDDGKLYMLQTRTGKRTGFAAIRMAMEMLEEGLIDEKTALKRIQPDQLTQLLAPIFSDHDKKTAKDKLVAKGLNAGPGAASGKVALSKEAALKMKLDGIACILVREETNPGDFPGMVAAEGILTVRGGSTSHAAVVARGMGKPCVVGCGALTINTTTHTLSAHEQTINEGDAISIDGATGEVYFCEIPTSPSEIVQVLVTKTKPPQESLVFQHYQKIMNLADHYRVLRVRTNADNPVDCETARAFGAEGIGLCRTEHMFMDVMRLNDVRRMLFSTSIEERNKAIEHLLPHQKKDFVEILRIMTDLPVTIRLLDPPLHEFLPHNEKDLKILATNMQIPHEKMVEIETSLKEHNPMLGHRGCRLGITYPELTEMQTRAILEAAIEVTEEGKTVYLEIMLPLIGIKKEMEHQKALIQKTAEKVFKEKGRSIPFSIGTMIELPRAALIADEIAKDAEFFSFGTNDLTQTVFGISRDDSAKFIPEYVKGVYDSSNPDVAFHILPDDPFQVIDREGVGKLIQMAITLGRKTRDHLKCGICGEHGGDPISIQFFHELGLDYVSCSPYRVPVARLAAAIAAIEKNV